MEIDKLNNLSSEEYIEEYFNEMDMTTEQKDERKKAATDFNDFVLLMFAIIYAQNEYGYVDYESVKEQFATGYMDRIAQFIAVDTALNKYALNFADETIGTTESHLASELSKVIGVENTLAVLSDSYYLSEARAVDMACNMALDVVNYKDFVNAVARGFKHKVWIAIHDKRTRKTHDIADGQVVPIGEYFHVGNSLLMFPHDSISGFAEMKELCNCRCSYKYIR